MIDFEYFSPTKIIFGRGKESVTGHEVRKYADSALVVCSRGRTNATGVVDRTLASLTEAGVSYIELTGIKPNPVLSKVYEGIDIVRRNNLKFILAIGGGSVIDTAKSIAVGVPYDGDVWDLFRGTPIEKTLPVGSVLTIPAAGSEASCSCVLTNEAIPLKVGFMNELFRPVFAIENPELTLSLDKWNTFCGIADMMMHILERYISKTPNTDVTDRLCEGLLKSEMKNALILLDDPSNYEARAEIMLASTYSHSNITGVGRAQEWVMHGLSQALGGLYDVTHGAALTAIGCSWMRFCLDDVLPRFVQMAMRVFDVEYDPENPRRTALEGIARLEAFFRRIGMPVSLMELGVPADDQAIIRAAEDYVSKGVRGNLRKIFLEDAVAIFQMARE
jgi:alcohol dehydrogenase YqhD (iron-dependent ADH family)